MKTGGVKTLFVGFLMLQAVLSYSQQHATGTQPFGTFGGGPDIINLGNLNVHLAIPVVHKAGRGLPFNYDLSYDSDAIWTPVTSGGSTKWSFAGNGWPLPQSAAGYIPFPSSESITITCPPNYIKTTITIRLYPGYVDWHGTFHHAPVSTTTGGCGTRGQGATTTADDGSGFTVTIPYGAPPAVKATVVTKDGATLTVPTGSGMETLSVDANGNEITATTSNGQFFDTLSSTAPVLTITGYGTSQSPVTYAYTAPAGATSTVVTYKTYPIQTHFQCAAVTDYGVSAPVNHDLVDKITLADGSFYKFTYEPTVTGSPNVTGRIASVIYPTGGTISYAYTGTNGGINCSDGSTMGFQRTTPDSGTAWQYSRANTNGTNWTTTVTDPLSNVTTYNFYEIILTQTGTTASFSSYLFYERSRSSNGLSVSTCYNAVYTSCGTNTVSLPISQLDRYRTIGTSPTFKTALVETLFDVNNGGRMTEQRVYDYGVNTGSAPTNTHLLADTVITYATLTGIIDHPHQVTVKDGAGHIQSQTTYAYDAAGVTGTTGTPQHTGPPNGSRGNLTSVTMLTSGTSTLTKSFSYYDTGNVNVATDVNSATQTYTYGACGNSFTTQVVTAPIPLTQKMAWNCTGGVMTSTTDPNGNVANTSYTTDPHFWRPEYATDLAGNRTNFSYPSLIQTESTMTFNGGNSETDNRIQLDGFARPLVSQIQQAAGGNYDSVETTYDGLGRPAFVSMPYTGAAGSSSCPGSCPGVSTVYDALGRPQSVSDANGGSLSYTYPGNDVYQSLGPAPTGENTKDKQLEYDGAGRLTSVCEVLKTGGTSCGQTGTASGYKTSYAYSVPASGGGSQMVVTQGAQSRTYVYDALGRLLAEKNPETGQTSYSYDVAGGCGGAPAYPGHLVLTTFANGATICYEYDGLGRVSDENGTYAGAGSCKRFKYDNSSGVLGKLPSGISPQNYYGRLVEAETDTCAQPITSASMITDEWFSYSARGETTDTYESTPNSGGYYHSFASYWANGALETRGLLSSSNTSIIPTLTYSLDGEGRTTSVSAASGQNPVSSVTYSTGTSTAPDGALTSVVFGSQDSDGFQYDPNTGRMTQYSFNVNGQSAVGDVDWNPNGTLQQLGITDPFNSQDNQTCADSYDDLARLTGVNCGSLWTQAFSYDAYGNITKTGSSSWMPGYTASTNQYSTPTNCLTQGGSPCYDAAGNLLRDTINTYTWDAYGKMTSVNSATLTYDALGRMVEAQNSASGPLSQFVYPPYGGAYFAVMTAQSLQIALAPLPGGTSAVYYPSVTFYAHSDWLGSTRLLSSTGRGIVPTMAYAPFGEGYAGGSPTFVTFTSDGYAPLVDPGQNDNGTLDDFVFRHYSPGQGRWISPDPAGFGAVDPTNPQTWNRYSYVANNPLSYTDPLGLDRCLDANGDESFDDSVGGNDYNCALGGGTWVIEQDPTNVTNVSADVSRVPTLADDAEFFDMWASGVGPSTINYGPNDGMTQQLANTATFNKIRQTYIRKGCPNSGKPMGTDHVGPWLEGYGTGNAALMQVGGFVASGQTNGGVTTFTAVNVAGMASFMGETTWAPIFNEIAGSNIDPNGMNNPKGPTGPYHNITQTFTWSENNLCQQGG